MAAAALFVLATFLISSDESWLPAQWGWPVLAGLAGISGGGALWLSRFDDRADDPFCFAWAAVALGASAWGVHGWRRGSRLERKSLLWVYLALWLTGLSTARLFGV